jgi:hypothetical protein
MYQSIGYKPNSIIEFLILVKLHFIESKNIFNIGLLIVLEKLHKKTSSLHYASY